MLECCEATNGTSLSHSEPKKIAVSYNNSAAYMGGGGGCSVGTRLLNGNAMATSPL